MNPLRSNITIITQFFPFIPRNLIPQLVKKHGVDKKERTFSPNSHIIALMYAQETLKYPALTNLWDDCNIF